MVKDFNEREAEIVAWAVASEGCITLFNIQPYGKNKRTQIRPSVQISNTELIFLVKLRKMCGGSIYLHHRKFEGHKDVYQLVITGKKSVLKFLEKIYPFLPIKRKQAKTVMAFCKSRLKRKKKAPYNKYEVSLAKKIRILNKRGTKK